MKHATGELNKTVIVSIAVVAIGILVFVIIGINKNFFKNMFNDKESNATVEADNKPSKKKEKEKSIKYDVIYVNGQMAGLKNYLNKQVYYIDRSDSNVATLSKKTDNALEKLGTKAVKCINECSSVTKTVSKDYYKTSNGYLVSVKDDKNNSYIVSFNSTKDILGNSKFELNNVYNNTSSLSKSINTREEISNKDGNSDEVFINYGYDETYVSQANVKANKLFSENGDYVNLVYNKNINSVVMLNSYSDSSIVENASGFYLTDSLIMTSWSYVLDAIKNNYVITSVDNAGNNNNVVGIVSMEENSDVAILKMEKSNGTPVTLADSKVGDEVLLLTSNTGFGISGSVGVIMSSGDIETCNLSTNTINNGSPVFNSDGEAVGMVLDSKSDTNLSLILSSNIIKKYEKLYSKASYDSIKSYDLNNLTNEFYSMSFTSEKVNNTTNNSLYNKYKDLFDINLDLVKIGNNKDNSISLRYKNSSDIDNDVILSSFFDNLKKKGYKEKLNTVKKKEYTGDLNIVIYYEFDYIIIIVKEK